MNKMIYCKTNLPFLDQQINVLKGNVDQKINV